MAEQSGLFQVMMAAQTEGVRQQMLADPAVQAAAISSLITTATNPTIIQKPANLKQKMLFSGRSEDLMSFLSVLEDKIARSASSRGETRCSR